MFGMNCFMCSFVLGLTRPSIWRSADTTRQTPDHSAAQHGALSARVQERIRGGQRPIGAGSSDMETLKQALTLSKPTMPGKEDVRPNMKL
eukprot:2336763-Amphidinium_carterae.1